MVFSLMVKKDGQVTFVKAETISDDSRTKENGKT